MRVVIVGATGNVGTSVLDAVLGDPAGYDIVGVARRRPQHLDDRIAFVEADITKSDLVPIFRGADVVVHLAWLIQPGRDESVTHAVNVVGSERLFAACVQANVGSLLYASSIGAYSPGPKDRLVDESWPTEGIQSAFYARHKAAVERQLDRLERERPGLRVVRMRPALVFKREAATEIRRLFAGPFLPRALVRPQLIPFVPDLPRLRFQVVHSLDVGEAFRRALASDARGAFNLAADPPLGPAELSELLHARTVRLPTRVLRAGAALTYRVRLQPTEPGWLDMGLAVPLIDSGRARHELGWEPSRSAGDTLLELLGGLHAGSDRDTPPLSRSTSGAARIRELMTAVGGRV